MKPFTASGVHFNSGSPRSLLQPTAGRWPDSGKHAPVRKGCRVLVWFVSSGPRIAEKESSYLSFLRSRIGFWGVRYYECVGARKNVSLLAHLTGVRWQSFGQEPSTGSPKPRVPSGLGLLIGVCGNRSWGGKKDSRLTGFRHFRLETLWQKPTRNLMEPLYHQ